MQRIFWLLCLLFPIPFFMSLAPDMLVSFVEQTTWNTAKEQAVQEQKLFFVDFDANYCAACRKMDQSTFMDASLAEYMTRKVVALKVDVQEIEGMRWSQQYNIEALPTMLVFDEEGKLVKRLLGYQSAEDLMTVFKGLEKELSYQPATADVPLSQPKPQPEQAPVQTPSSPTAEPAKPVASSSSTAAAPEMAPVSEAKPFEEEGIYELKVRKTNPSGYSVQVGVFGDYDNVIRLAEKLGAETQQKTFVRVERLNGKLLYHLLVGLFPARRQAGVMRNNLLMRGYDAMIYRLGEENLS